MRFGLRPKSRAQGVRRVRSFEFLWIWRHQRRAYFPALVRQIEHDFFEAARSRGFSRPWNWEVPKGSILVNIIVCIKQVPAKDAPLTIAGNWIKESDIGFEMNEPDSYALEEALRLKEKHGGEVIALSLGPERVKQTIKEALATLLDRPHATIIMAIEVADGKMKLKRELEAGWFQHIECPLPAVLTIQSGINKVRYATLKGIMAAKKKEIATITRESLGVPVEPTQRVEKIYVPTKTKKTEFLSGPPKEVAAKLVERLKFEARVI